MRTFFKWFWSKLKTVSRVAWVLIAISVAYVVAIPVLCQYTSFDNAVTIAQIFYVLALGIALAILHILKRQRKLNGYQEQTARDFLYLKAALSSIRRYISDRRARSSVSKTESDD